MENLLKVMKIHESPLKPMKFHEHPTSKWMITGGTPMSAAAPPIFLSCRWRLRGGLGDGQDQGTRLPGSGWKIGRFESHLKELVQSEKLLEKMGVITVE